jgi:endonuclease/exonuclease/phosphatase family metal-dependent hydrolase
VAKVKIITINTWKCDGDYYRRISLLAEQLKALKPDVIACQECFISEEAPHANTLKFLAEQLNMKYLFTSGRSKKRYFEGKWVDSQSGLGILSVYPLHDVASISLPAVAEDNDRKAQQVEVLLPDGQKLLVTNVHLTHLKNVALRKQQAEFVAEKTKSLQNYPYKIVCGDFNAEPSSAEVKAFINNSHAIDCYTAGNGYEPRYSLMENLQQKRHVCVDHIFAFPFTNGGYPNFTDSAVVLNQPDASGLYASDHFGISTTLLIEQ